MKKRILAVIMCVFMVVAYMPGMAFATGSNSTSSGDGTVVAKVGDTDNYTALQEAINAAGENNVVTLIENDTISESTAVKNLTIADGVTLNFSGTGKLTVTGTLTVNGTLDLTGVNTTSFTNDTAGDSRTLKINNGADLIVNGTLKSKAQFNDILQLGTMTINSGATVIVGKIEETDITYIGTGGTIVLGTGAQIVQKPRTENKFADGYTYELSGSATVGSLDSSNSFGTMYVSGKDQFIVNDKATLTVSKMAMATGSQTGTVPTLENHIIVKEGGILAVAENGELDLSISEGPTTYSSDAVDKDKRLILIEQGGFFNVSGTVKSNNSFNDICQLGKMTINSTAKYMASSTVTYMGPSTETSAVAKLASGATVVSEPNTADSFADGYTYTLTGNAEAGIGTDAATAFAIGGNDRFIVKSGSTLTATSMKLAGAKSDQLIIESGAKLDGSVRFADGVAKLWKVSSGTFTFDPSDYLATSRYYVKANGDDAYTVLKRSSSSGSSGGGSVVKTETNTNSDGSTTKTETKSDGTKVETTTAKDGSKTVVESKTTTDSKGSKIETTTETVTAKDGSKTEKTTETVTKADGSKTEIKSETVTATDGAKKEIKSEVTTAADGTTMKVETAKTTDAAGSTGTVETKTDAAGNTTVQAEASVSTKAVEEAQKSDKAVTVPVEVKATSDSKSAPVVNINIEVKSGGKSGKSGVKIEVPVTNVNSGTVAVLVKADGTEEIIKTTVPAEDGVQITVDGNVTIKIVDNSKSFTDTSSHWSKDEVNFVAARGIFNGVGNNDFGVSDSMTRGMVNTVLARLAGANTEGGANWYDKGNEWAVANGVSDGSSPTASVTREQLATMLYRFAGSPEVSGDLNFADSGTISGYAQNALLWASRVGIIGGMGDNTVAPTAGAERAQVAAMLARYIKLAN